MGCPGEFREWHWVKLGEVVMVGEEPCWLRFYQEDHGKARREFSKREQKSALHLEFMLPPFINF